MELGSEKRDWVNGRASDCAIKLVSETAIGHMSYAANE
jgi:hypothetical protein